MKYCQHCGNQVDIEEWLQKIYPNVCNTCLIDGTHKGPMKRSLISIIREDQQ